MATTTTNLHLTKPSVGDRADITVINENMDLIDQAVDGYVSAEDPVGITDTVPPTFDGHPIEDFLLQTDAEQFVKVSDVDSSPTSGSSDPVSSGGVHTALQDKVDKTGGTMAGALVAQSNTNYTTAQVRNVIISTASPSGGSPGDIWIKYTA